MDGFGLKTKFQRREKRQTVVTADWRGKPLGSGGGG